MKLCEKCGTEHEKPGRFCSRKCANSRTWTDEINEKRSKSLKGKPSPKISYDRSEAIEKCKENWYQKYLSTPFDELGITGKRKRVFDEQNYHCNKCGLNSWLSFPITLELEHKDGNNKNNTRENLEALCPNCHSLTPTWRGRNNKGNITVSNEELLQNLKSSKNIKQALLKSGLAGKGSNYKRVKRLLDSNEEIDESNVIDL